MFGAVVVVGADAPPVAAITGTQVAATETQVATLENTIADEQAQGAALDTQYLAAQATVQEIQSQLAATQKLLVTTRSHVKADRSRLAQAAAFAYVYDEPVSRIDAMFTNSPAGATARNQYLNTVVGNISLAVSKLATQQQRLAAATGLEQSQEQQAAAAADRVQALGIANQQAAAAATATLDQVRGSLAVQVAQYALQQAQNEAAIAAANPNSAPGAARAATKDAAVTVALGSTNAAQAAAAANQAVTSAGGASALGTTLGSISGTAAVTAAESQLGVPYVWGGETPGGGFDCSGLTQWSWRQAGFNIPRVAALQAAAIPHVPLTALEPGDLLFYYNLDGDHQIDHVVMYVGSGPYGTQTIIQAPYTGSTVQYAPLFTEGLVAAGRP